MSKARHPLGPKLYYFFFFAAGASMGPYLPMFYESVGMSGNRIGLLSALNALLVVVAAPLWGSMADATRRHKQLLLASLCGAIVLSQVIFQAHSFAGLLFAITFFAAFAAPLMALLDHTTIDLLGERRAEYGRVRLWGTLGWMIASPAVGWMIDRGGLRWGFGCYALFLSGAVLAVWRLPVRRMTTQMNTAILKGFSLVYRDSRWFLFIFSTLIAGIGQAAVFYYLFLYLKHLGFSKTFMGWTMVFSTTGELPVMFFGPYLIRRWGSRTLLTLSMVATALRALSYSWTDTGWVILMIQLLHGPSFGFLWIAGVARAHEIAPPGMNATAQGLFSSVAMGVGGALAAMFGGTLYEAIGAPMMFRYTGLLIIVGLLFRILAARLIHLRQARA